MTVGELVDSLNDEEFGRWWAERNEKRPREDEGGRFGWQSDRWSSVSAFSVPDVMYPTAVYWYDSESEAYAAVGSALRRVIAFAEAVRSDLWNKIATM